MRLCGLATRRPLSLVGALISTLLVTLLALSIVRISLTFFLLAGIVFSSVIIWFRRRDPLHAMPALFTFLAFTLSLMVEYVVLVGDIGRMNTVFKFYYQIWVFMALGSALALPGVLSMWCGWKTRLKQSWMCAFILLAAASLLYPLLGTPAKIHDRFIKTSPTLNGLVFAEKGIYPLKGVPIPLKPDLDAIRWLQDTVEGSPVILEMNTGNLLYSWGSRYSIHTGLPSIVGWNWHQRQQQAGIRDNRVMSGLRM
jgi:uncharacterized membrane protein